MPRLCTATLCRDSVLQLYAATLYCNSVPRLCTATLCRDSVLQLYAATLYCNSMPRLCTATRNRDFRRRLFTAAVPRVDTTTLCCDSISRLRTADLYSGLSNRPSGTPHRRGADGTGRAVTQKIQSPPSLRRLYHIRPPARRPVRLSCASARLSVHRWVQRQLRQCAPKGLCQCPHTPRPGSLEPTARTVRRGTVHRECAAVCP